MPHTRNSIAFVLTATLIFPLVIMQHNSINTLCNKKREVIKLHTSDTRTFYPKQVKSYYDNQTDDKRTFQMLNDINKIDKQWSFSSCKYSTWVRTEHTSSLVTRVIRLTRSTKHKRK